MTPSTTASETRPRVGAATPPERTAPERRGRKPAPRHRTGDVVTWVRNCARTLRDKGSIRAAAKETGVPRSTLEEKLERYGYRIIVPPPLILDTTTGEFLDVEEATAAASTGEPA